MKKKVWTPAMRAAFAKKMAKYRKKPKRARALKKRRSVRHRRKNPPKVKHPRGFEVRVGTRKKRKLVWTAQTRADAIHVAKVYAKAFPRKVVSVHAEK